MTTGRKVVNVPDEMMHELADLLKKWIADDRPPAEMAGAMRCGLANVLFIMAVKEGQSAFVDEILQVPRLILEIVRQIAEKREPSEIPARMVKFLDRFIAEELARTGLGRSPDVKLS